MGELLRSDMGVLTPSASSPRGWKASPLVIVCFALLVRYMVSLWPYSGQGEQPTYGDYEAQRHWMEITTALPLHQWYRFDLAYWGLDYPPLTAYVSWACGQLSRVIEPASMVLGLSRGYETPSHKAFMRLTVLVLDVAVFFPAAAWLASRVVRGVRNKVVPGQRWGSAGIRAFLMVLLQPSLVLIDHGHFQYNSVCLGLAMAGAAAVASGQRRGELVGSVLFSLSLNFKQMALYYAPAFFFYLLASCIWGAHGGNTVGGGTNTAVSARWTAVVGRVSRLGLVVGLTFALLWGPFCVCSETAGGGGCMSSLGQVLRRLFPFSRGLFEDKVANLWFCMDVVFKLRRRFAVPFLAKLALATTLSMLMPVGAELLRPGRPLTAKRLSLALFNSSMAFFLCSFQVHEKSLLLPLCPLAFLWEASPLFVTWVQVVGVFSIKPLLGREGLLVPCAVCTVLYVGASAVLAPAHNADPYNDGDLRSTVFPYGRYLTQARLRAMVALSLGGVVVLLALEAGLKPPEGLPHIHPTLNALYSCANLTVAFSISIYWQWQEGGGNNGVEGKRQAMLLSESKKAR